MTNDIHPLAGLKFCINSDICVGCPLESDDECIEKILNSAAESIQAKIRYYQNKIYNLDCLLYSLEQCAELKFREMCAEPCEASTWLENNGKGCIENLMTVAAKEIFPND